MGGAGGGGWGAYRDMGVAEDSVEIPQHVEHQADDGTVLQQHINFSAGGGQVVVHGREGTELEGLVPHSVDISLHERLAIACDRTVMSGTVGAAIHRGATTSAEVVGRQNGEGEKTGDCWKTHKSGRGPGTCGTLEERAGPDAEAE